MDNEIVLKGCREGLLLVVTGEPTFPEVSGVLRHKLEAAGDFFTKSPVPMLLKYKGTLALLPEQHRELKELAARFGLVYDDSSPGGEPLNQDEPRPGNCVAPEDAVMESVLTLNRTLRGGQEIKFKGTVMVVGDVNPSARIFAEHNIIVTGVSRGVLHAGALGDSRARVMAGRFLSGQIRIADCIVRAPDEDVPRTGPERALIKDGQIIIESIHR